MNASAPPASERVAGSPSALYAMRPGRPKLRVTLVVSACDWPAWLAEMLKGVLDADFLDVQILRDTPTPSRRRGSAAWRLYQRLDRTLLGELEPILAEAAPDTRLLSAPRPSGLDGLRNAVAAFSPDVLLCVGHSPAPIALWPLARRAAWSIPAEACSQAFGLMHLLPAFLRGESSALSGLPVYDDRVGSSLLLDPTEVSIAQLSFVRNTAYQLQKAPAKLLRSLRRIQQGLPVTSVQTSDERPPSMMATVLLAARLAGRSLLRRLPRLSRVERWVLAARVGSKTLDPIAPDGTEFEALIPPDGWFWADPFPWTHDGQRHVFFEAYDYSRAIGEIHVFAVDEDGTPSPSERAIVHAHHLSYPFPFEVEGQPHLLVECATSLALTAFRAVDYPRSWVPAATLLQGWRVVDGTLTQHEGRWWLFACIAETPFDDGGREFTELFLFFADEPFGTWQPHPQNPVVSGVSSARPAGPLFWQDGRLVRPSQDSAAEYGHRIVFSEVVRMDTEHYEERPLATLNPDWAPGLRGCHTYSRGAGIELLDAKMLVPAARTRASKPASS